MCCFHVPKNGFWCSVQSDLGKASSYSNNLKINNKWFPSVHQKFPYDKVEITDTSQVSILDALTVSSTTSDVSNLIDDTLDISSLNDDGSQADNERIAWDDLWQNIKDDSNAPRSSVAYAAGLNYRDNIEIFQIVEI